MRNQQPADDLGALSDPGAIGEVVWPPPVALPPPVPAPPGRLWLTLANALCVGSVLVGFLLVQQVMGSPEAMGSYDQHPHDWKVTLGYCLASLGLAVVLRVTRRVSRWAFWFGLLLHLCFVGMLLSTLGETRPFTD